MIFRLYHRTSQALQPTDRTCLLIQALHAFASARPGLVSELDEEVYVWHGEDDGTRDGEWFLGKVVTCDPFRVAHYMHFFRERPDKTRESVNISNTWIQLWRSTEHLLDQNPAI